MADNPTLEQLRYFLKEMFQFNYNDLDFSIFKNYNLKRDQITNFIEGNGKNDLVTIIDQTLDEVAGVCTNKMN